MHEGRIRIRSVHPLFLYLQTVGSAVARSVGWREGFLYVPALLPREKVRHLAGDGVDEILVVQVALAAGEVGDRPAHEERDEAAYERVVHVGHRVELG